MKYITLLIFWLPIIGFSEEPCLDGTSTGLDDIVKKVSIPNCFTFNKLNLAKKGKFSSLCGECKDSFYANSALNIKKSNPSEERKNAFLKIAFQEYKKNQQEVRLYFH